MAFLPALLLGLLIVATAPFMGRLQKIAKESLEGGQLVTALTVFFVVSGLGILLAVLWRARAGARSETAERRRSWPWVLTGAALVVAQIALSDRGSASAAAYERLHFILYGLLAILLVRAFARSLPASWSVLGAAAGVLGVGLLDEGVQWLVPLRTGELFDLGLNLYGGLAGLLVAQALPVAKDERGPAGRRTVAVLVTVVLLGVVVFIDRAHLGHRIVDAELGTFHSFFTADQLAEANDDRRETWADDMPQLPLRRALDIEDYFLTEAGWHVLLRNRAREAGDLETTWHETRILERYYPATLEIPNGRGWFRYRLPEQERSDLDRFTPRGQYFSPADNGRIWLWPRGGLLLAVAAALLLGRLLWRRAAEGQSQPSRVSSIS